MTRTIVLLARLGFAVCVSGCSANDGESLGFNDTESLLPDQEMVAKEAVLAELLVDGQTITFLRWGEGDSSQLVLRTAGAARGGNAIDALQMEAGELTMLEIFEAFASEDQIPPPELVDAHAEQAEALSRADDGMRLVPKQQFPPAGQSPCNTDLTFPPPFVWSAVEFASFGRFFICTGLPVQTGTALTSSSCTLATTNRQRVSICNVTSPTNVPANAGFGVPGGALQTTSVVNVNPGQYMVWEYLPSGTARRLAVEALGGAGSIYGLKAGVGG